jgi:enterochelin esterase family protein
MQFPRAFLTTGLALVAAHAALAQVPAAPSTPSVVSPQVHSDRRVTFQIAAPLATKVTFKGDWHHDVKTLERDADGVWSLTVDPLEPGKYIYNFTLDGVVVADPANARVKLRQQGQGSFFEVRGERPGLWDPRDVPHGAIEINTQQSAVLGESREFLVYTPPGYEKEPTRRYPVLYLQHGSNDRPQGWVDIANLHYLTDNLIAEGRAQPMIIVMPVAHALPMGSRATGKTNAQLFEEYLIADVMPAVEQKYRVASGRPNHAIAGFSMGGDISLRVFANHADRFSALGVFSPAPGARAVPGENPGVFDATKLAATLDAFYLACGQQDNLYPVSTALHETLDQLGIRHLWRSTDGYHNYALWRQHLAEFLPLLFRGISASQGASR